MSPLHTLRRGLPLLMLLAAALPCHALYKVVGPDGRVTYTDRPPVDPANKVTPLAVRNTLAIDVPLPLDLRQAVARFPATLYVTVDACPSCEAARQLLRQRGVPFNERHVQSNEDGDALQRLTGARDVPVLTLGPQTLRGLAAEVWGSYLDAAGYPRESRLPASYQYPAPLPVAERRPAPETAPPPPRPTVPSAADPSDPPIRF